MWRSGSSLLYALLNKHPQVGLMYEADLLLLRSVFAKPPGMRDWAKRWQFWNQAFTRHGLNPDEFTSMTADFASAFASVHKRFAQRKGATIWGDKSPNYYDRLQEMAQTFPHAKFILVWRDPFGTANSIVRAGNTGNHYFRQNGAALRGLMGNQVFKQQYDWLVAHSRSVLDLSYEDLVANPSAVMMQVCGFLEIPYSDDLASLEGADRSAIFDGQHHSNVKGDTIVSGPRPNALDEKLRLKISRYLVLWRKRYTDTWPPFPLWRDSQLEQPSFTERLRDRLTYRSVRAIEAFPKLCFCMVPLSWLRSYRDRKYRGNSDSRPKHSSPIGLNAPQSVVKEA
jgi:hypothetical protein